MKKKITSPQDSVNGKFELENQIKSIENEMPELEHAHLYAHVYLTGNEKDDDYVYVLVEPRTEYRNKMSQFYNKAAKRIELNTNAHLMTYSSLKFFMAKVSPLNPLITNYEYERGSKIKDIVLNDLIKEAKCKKQKITKNNNVYKNTIHFFVDNRFKDLERYSLANSKCVIIYDRIN